MFLRRSVAAAGLVLGCQASMSADAKMNQEPSGQGIVSDPIEEDAPPLRQRPLTAAETARARESAANEPSSAAASAADAPDFALFGARHDFSVKDPSGAVGCQCVSVLLGPPSSGKLEWRGEMPRIKPETQLVVALVPGNCADGADGASYWGYRIEGNDVVVLLEAWKPSRPRTLGAIIPRPSEGGQVYVAPVSNALPYGKPTSGQGTRCGAGNPGPQRTTPLDSSGENR